MKDAVGTEITIGSRIVWMPANKAMTMTGEVTDLIGNDEIHFTITSISHRGLPASKIGGGRSMSGQPWRMVVLER